MGLDRYQFKEARLNARLGVQVVSINADLAHFHSTPSSLERRIEGADPIGSRAAANTSATIAMSKDRFIAVTFLYRWALIFDVGFSLSSRAGKMASSKGLNHFVGTWPTKHLHRIATGNPAKSPSGEADGLSRGRRVTLHPLLIVRACL